MFGRKALTSLQAPKRLFILEGDLSRLALRADLGYLRTCMAPIRDAVQNRRKLCLFCLFAAPLAGFVVVRRLRRKKCTGDGLGSVLKLLPPLPRARSERRFMQWLHQRRPQMDDVDLNAAA